jgi:4-carboxymuconolactone decarboxylase
MTDWPAPRLAPPDPASLDAAQKAAHDAIAAGPRGSVRGPLAVWLHRPELAQCAQALGAYCRYGTLLPPRLSELAIISVAKVWGSEYEWYAHKKLALEAGVDPSVVEAIRTGAEPPFADPKESVVHRFAITAHRERRVPDALYAEAVELLGEPAVLDLVGICGYYALISLTINVFGVYPPADAPRELS